MWLTAMLRRGFNRINDKKMVLELFLDPENSVIPLSARAHDTQAYMICLQTV